MATKLGRKTMPSGLSAGGDPGAVAGGDRSAAAGAAGFGGF